MSHPPFGNAPPMFTTITDNRPLFPTDRNGHVWQFAMSVGPSDYVLHERHCGRCGQVERTNNKEWFAMVKGDGYCAEFAQKAENK